MSSPDEQIAADAEEAIGDQTTVRIRVPMIRRGDGTYYLDVNTKPDLKTIVDFVALCNRIATHSQGSVHATADTALVAATDLGVLYEAIEKPKTE